jgi:hypothetical protein
MAVLTTTKWFSGLGSDLGMQPFRDAEISAHPFRLRSSNTQAQATHYLEELRHAAKHERAMHMDKKLCYGRSYRVQHAYQSQERQMLLRSTFVRHPDNHNGKQKPRSLHHLKEHFGWFVMICALVEKAQRRLGTWAARCEYEYRQRWDVHTCVWTNLIANPKSTCKDDRQACAH